MKKLIITEAQLNTIKKSLNENVDMEDILQQLNAKYDNMFEKVSKHPDFILVDGGEVGNSSYDGTGNKCETNVYNRVHTKDYQIPVVGFIIFKDSLNYIEHYWIYHSYFGTQEVTPNVTSKDFYYLGIKNESIIEEIENSKRMDDIDFFRSGNFYSKYMV